MLQYSEDYLLLNLQRLKPYYLRLISDQKYLLEICLAIKQGCVTTNLANKQPGRLAHSRCLTCQNGLLTLYVATKYPSKNLIKLAEAYKSVCSNMVHYNNNAFMQIQS
nr:unnamed protein product [Callosobruchus analis]